MLKPGEDLCVSFLDMPVKSEEPESLAAIVTGAYATSGNFWSKSRAGKEYCFELREKAWNSVHSIVHLSSQQVWKLK